MISRESASLLGEIYQIQFTKYYRPFSGRIKFRGIERNSFYDFLFEHNYPLWLCKKAKKIRNDPRSIKEFIMGLHTGETQYLETSEWSVEKREQLGQNCLRQLSEDVLNQFCDSQGNLTDNRAPNQVERLLRRLELDGYLYSNGKLLTLERLETRGEREELGVLKKLYISLELENEETTFHHLNLSIEHYLDEKWDDSISNSRKFLECVLREVAVGHSLKFRDEKLSDETYNWAKNVRHYLNGEGLLEKKEEEAIKVIYGLLSETGGHPYMAYKDQARLLQNLALIFAQFIMLRFKGILESSR